MRIIFNKKTGCFYKQYAHLINGNYSFIEFNSLCRLATEKEISLLDVEKLGFL